VGINLGGRDIGVPQHHLHAAQVRSTLQQVGGEAVPQHMGRQPVENARLAAVRGQQLPETLAGEATAARGYEKISAGAALEKRAAPVPEPSLDGMERGPAHRHQPLFVALAGDAHNAHGRIQIAHGNAAQLGDAQAGGIEQLQHGAVAQAGGQGSVDGLQNPVDLLQIQELRDGLPLPRKAQVLGGIGFDQAFPQEKPIKIPKGGQMAGDGTVAQTVLV
jgi:hypothetical protein